VVEIGRRFLRQGFRHVRVQVACRHGGYGSSRGRRGEGAHDKPVFEPAVYLRGR